MVGKKHSITRGKVPCVQMAWKSDVHSVCQQCCGAAVKNETLMISCFINTDNAHAKPDCCRTRALRFPPHCQLPCCLSDGGLASAGAEVQGVPGWQPVKDPSAGPAVLKSQIEMGPGNPGPTPAQLFEYGWIRGFRRRVSIRTGSLSPNSRC